MPLGVLATRDGQRYTWLGWHLGWYLGALAWWRSPFWCERLGHKPRRYSSGDWIQPTIVCDRCDEVLSGP